VIYTQSNIEVLTITANFTVSNLTIPPNCPGPSPSPSFSCENGIWVANGNQVTISIPIVESIILFVDGSLNIDTYVNISQSHVSITGNLHVDQMLYLHSTSIILDGNLTLTSNSVINLDSFSNSTIEVKGCAELSGDLVLNVSTRYDFSIPYEIMNAACFIGGFATVTVRSADESSCSSITAMPETRDHYLVLVLTSNDICVPSGTGNIVPYGLFVLSVMLFSRNC
jgi:hypothetical protein